MKFNIALGNHPAHGINTTRDHTLIIKGGLEEAGHLAQLSQNDVFKEEINIFYDFITPESVGYYRELHNAGYQYGLITTEILTENGINHLDNDTTRSRIEATREVARNARFLWVMHEPSLENYKTLAAHERCYSLPLGYTSKVHEIRRLRFEDRDIDFLFFGYLTPYRAALIEKLTSKGFVTRCIYNVPGFIRNSMIERSKINLALRQTDTWDQPSVGRISYLVSNRCAVVAEQTAFGQPYENYVMAVLPQHFIEACVKIISQAEYWITADKLADDFQRDYPMKFFMERLIEQTFGAL